MTLNKTLALLLAMSALGACSGDSADETPAALQQAAASAAAITAAPAFSADELLSQPTQNWITSGGSLLNQRFSPLGAINRSNIAQVKADWPGRPCRRRTDPGEFDNRAYLHDRNARWS